MRLSVLFRSGSKSHQELSFLLSSIFFMFFFIFFQINNFQILSGQQIRWSTFFSTLLGPLKKALARWPLSRLRLRDLFGGEWRWD